jgi:hypothetical protein
MRPDNIQAQYDYSQTDRLDGADKPFSGTLSHTYSLSNPNHPLDDLTLTFEMSGTNSEDSLLGMGVRPDVLTYRNHYTGAIRSTYMLNLSKPLKLPDFWPFYGRELKFTQAIRLNNDVTADLVSNDSVGDNHLSALNTSLYSINDGVSYNVLTNFQLTFTMKNEWFKNNTIQYQDYYAITLKLDAVATF